MLMIHFVINQHNKENQLYSYQSLLIMKMIFDFSKYK